MKTASTFSQKRKNIKKRNKTIPHSFSLFDFVIHLTETTPSDWVIDDQTSIIELRYAPDGCLLNPFCVALISIHHEKSLDIHRNQYRIFLRPSHFKLLRMIKYDDSFSYGEVIPDELDEGQAPILVRHLKKIMRSSIHDVSSPPSLPKNIKTDTSINFNEISLKADLSQAIQEKPSRFFNAKRTLSQEYFRITIHQENNHLYTCSFHRETGNFQTTIAPGDTEYHLFIQKHRTYINDVLYQFICRYSNDLNDSQTYSDIRGIEDKISTILKDSSQHLTMNEKHLLSNTYPSDLNKLTILMRDLNTDTLIGEDYQLTVDHIHTKLKDLETAIEQRKLKMVNTHLNVIQARGKDMTY